MSWSPLGTKLSIVDPGSNKVDRTERIAVESAKQCERAWTMSIERKTDLGGALRANTGAQIVVADASGEPYIASGAEKIALLIGPEGGWTDEELQACKAAGARVCTFGVHVMRIEVAAPVAVACIIDHERRVPS